MDNGKASVEEGTVACASWIRRPENAQLVVIGKSNPSSLEIFSFHPKTTSLSPSPKAKYAFEGECEPVSIAVHPSGDVVVCSTTTGCKLFELYGREDNLKLSCKYLIHLQNVGPQQCLAFSVDGSRLAAGGVDGHFRLYEWPNMHIIVDEPGAHKSFQDMDFSLDSEFLASTSTDGAARIWKTSDGIPVSSLARNPDEKFGLCRFSRDGTKPFLFCTVQKGDKTLIAVWDICEWKKIGHKSLLKKPASVMSVSLDGKYLAIGSKDGDVCTIEVKKMEVSHLSKRLHLGSNIASLEFCPSERVVLTTSAEWGPMVTKLSLPAEWKEWQLYLLLLGMFLASAVAFYVFFQKSQSFWNFPDPSSRPTDI
nr:SEC12-like protein 1 [Ipomoea batatas]